MQRIQLPVISQALVIFLYIMLIVFSPSVRFINYVEFHDGQRVIQLLLLGLVLLDAVIIGFRKTDTIPFNNQIRLGLFSLLTLTIASTAISIEPRYAIIEITIFAALSFLALFTARIYIENGENFIKLLTYALWASIVLYMVNFYTGYMSAMVFGKPLKWPAPFYGFTNIRLFQQYQLWTLGLICLPLLTFDLKKSIRLWLYFALTCWWVLLFYAASRGVVLGWLVAIAFTAIIYKKLAWPFLRIQILSAIAGLFMYQILFNIVPNWIITSAGTASAITTSTVFRDTFSDRTDLWKVALVMIYNFPFLGVGPMHFYFYNSFNTHPHNSLLQLAAEFGLPFTLIILTITIYSTYCWMKKFGPSQLITTSKSNSNLSIILLFTITASAAYSLVEGVIVMPISQVLMFTMIGLMIGQYTGKTQFTKSSHEFKTKLHFRPVFALIVLVFLTLSVMPELVRGVTSKDKVFSNNERAFSLAPNTINPRIWMQQRRIEPNQKQ
jgi:putative inorganic carbon (hco3(-)) transporter